MYCNRLMEGRLVCQKTLSMRIGTFLIFPLALLSLQSKSVAQVVVSVGIQEVYDDNIYLEDSKGVPPPIVIDSELENPDSNVLPPIQANGRPDDDIISNLSLGVSGITKFGDTAKGSADLRVGALIFSENTDESRLSLDSTLKVQTTPEFLKDPYYAAATSMIQSRSNDITTADGTAARQTESHTGALEFGVNNVVLAPHTRLNGGYTFAVTNFLGNLAFGSNSAQDSDAYNGRLEDRGSDYIANTLATTVDHDISDRLVAGVFGSVSDLIFTSVESNDQEPKEKEDLDRLESQVGVAARYQPNKEFGGDAKVGTGLTHLKNRPEDIIFNVIDSTGQTIQVEKDAEQNQVSFLFSTGMLYTPNLNTAIAARADQSQITDVDGDRVITRSFSLNGSQAFGDRFRTFIGGRFLQFNVGDSIDSPTERFELAATLRYSVTEAIAISTGWNYAKQDADEQNTQERFLLGSEDYESNRIFIGLDAGLVGVNK